MGRNVVQRLQDGGIEAKKGTQVTVPVGDIWAPPKGHPLYHPRFGDPVDPEMRDDILARGVEKPIKVRDDGVQDDGRRRLLLVDGGRRTCNALAAQTVSGQVLYVPIEFFTGDDAEVLLERIRANADPLKKADKPSILALTIRQYTALRPGAEPREIARELADVMPRGIGASEVEALARWNNLTAEARHRFDDGAPLGLLASVLDAPRAEQVATLDKLLAAGVRTAKGATRKANAEKAARDPWARRMSPRQLVDVAKHLEGRIHTIGTFKADVAMVAAVLRIASGRDVEAWLAALPRPLADAIREARAAKPARKGRAS